MLQPVDKYMRYSRQQEINQEYRNEGRKVKGTPKYEIRGRGISKESWVRTMRRKAEEES